MLKRILLALASLGLLAVCVSHNNQHDVTALPEPSLERIADGVWIHKSYQEVAPWGPVLSQGLVVKTAGGVFLVDTAWNDADTENLLSLIDAEIGEKPVAAIITHAHSDKIGGVGALNNAGIRIVLHQWTDEDARARGLQTSNVPGSHSISPEDWEKERAVVAVSHRGELGSLFGVSTPNTVTSNASSGSVTFFYPGPGHTRDNIVVYYAPAKVLFGGCLIRPGGSDNLGNTADADVAHWAEAVRNVAAAFADAEIVIPSHGPMGGRELLDHTIALAEAAADRP